MTDLRLNSRKILGASIALPVLQESGVVINNFRYPKRR